MVKEHLARILPPVAARCREVQQDKRAPLLSDPFACHLVEAFGPATEESEEDQLARVVHDAFLDRILLDAVSRRTRQAMLFGSGLDVRAFRLQLPPQLKVIEVDDPQVHKAKALVLEGLSARPRAALKRVAAAEADSTKPCLFIICVPTATALSAIPQLSEMAAEGSTVVAQILRAAQPEGAESVDADVAAMIAAFEASGWQRPDRVGHAALQRLFPVNAPADDVAAMVVAERGAPLMPQRPSAAGAKRKDGAPMSYYGWRGD
ncbi:unnamed protein product [Symbiodinium natans]|uniref:S-adenosyl-L-methionine-dependent methyltransferase n=1 Tax=Symbiodinium natans TaxID=878477 RepID=A0A812HUL3_9DINO|nr:unnamed protein product [Symbiodinium natans]